MTKKHIFLMGSVCLAVTCVIFFYFHYAKRLKAEYRDAALLSDISKWIDVHGGPPNSWEQLGVSRDEVSQMGFSLRFQAQEKETQSSDFVTIKPGVYQIVYPHFKRDMDAINRKVRTKK